MEITMGKIAKAPKIVIHGPPGVGKSTLASQFPDPLFIDTEDGSFKLDVKRTAKPTSWAMLMTYISELLVDNMGFRTVVIDTSDWAEKLAIKAVCAENNLISLGGQNDFGQSYNLLLGKWAQLLDSLSDLNEKWNMAVLLTAHSQVKKANVPEEFGAFDRYMLKMESKTSACTTEWCEYLLFANFKTIVVKDGMTKKAQGGERVLHTQRHVCWDAKSRDGIAPELPMKFASIAHLLSAAPQTATPPPQETSQAPAKTQAKVLPPPSRSKVQTSLEAAMRASGITANQVQQAVENHPKLSKVYPRGTPVTNWTDDFIEKRIVVDGAWPRVVETAKGYSNE